MVLYRSKLPKKHTLFINIIIRGKYSSENLNLLSFEGNIVVPFFDIDALGDIRDLYHDVQYWDNSWSHVQETALDSIGLLPVIGFIKYGTLKEGEELKVVKAEYKADKVSGIFKDVDETVLKDMIREHVFSDKHIKSGIMELGDSQNDILNKGLDIIKEIDSKNMIIEGSTQIKTYINGLEAEIRIFINNGKIVNFDMFKGWSIRDMGNSIYY